jgi:hypothetical protein
MHNDERFRARSDITAKPRSYVGELDFPTRKGDGSSGMASILILGAMKLDRVVIVPATS